MSIVRSYHLERYDTPQPYYYGDFFMYGVLILWDRPNFFWECVYFNGC